MSNKISSKILIDLDYTLGHLNVKSNSWFLYDGVEESLNTLKKKCSLVLITANKKSSVEILFNTFPNFSKNFSSVLTCEDIAPHFLTIIKEFSTAVSKGHINSDYNFLHFIYETWQKDRSLVLPKNFSEMSNTHLSYEDWEQKIYFPIIAPNKATFCNNEDFLIDDEFGNPSPNPIYKSLIDSNRAVFFGKRFGSTPSTGPDWSAITQFILNHPLLR